MGVLPESFSCFDFLLNFVNIRKRMLERRGFVLLNQFRVHKYMKVVCACYILNFDYSCAHEVC